MNINNRIAHNAKAVLNKLKESSFETNVSSRRIYLSKEEFEAITAHLNAIIEITEK